MFLSLFKRFGLKSIHCNDCELFKHKHASFPISNIKSLNFFSLIHNDIWGPIVPNIYGVKWFVSFIDILG